MMADGIREGSLRDIDPERAAFILFVAGDTLSNQSYYPHDEVLPLYQDIVIRGLIPR